MLRPPGIRSELEHLISVNAGSPACLSLPGFTRTRNYSKHTAQAIATKGSMKRATAGYYAAMASVAPVHVH